MTEFSSALSIKLRTGQIGPGHRAEVLAMFTRLIADSFITLPVSRLDFRMAARLVDQHALGLRAGDACIWLSAVIMVPPSAHWTGG